MAQDASRPTLPQPTTRIRFGVLAFVCALSMITYLDRVCFGAAGQDIVSALGLQSEADLQLAFMAFALSYAIFEIPTGWFGDVFGPKRTLIRIVLWWSFFTVATGCVGMTLFGYVLGGLVLLVIVRFLFGIGEAGAYPNITRALHNWFPYSERGLAQGSVWMAGRLMGGLTPLIWLGLVVGLDLTWRQAFWLFGGLGVLWCIWFALWFRNRPEEKPEVSASELEVIQAGRTDIGAGHAHVPWLQLLKDGNLWTLCLMYFCAAYGWYLNITYLPSLIKRLGTDPKTVEGAIYAGGPLWMGAIACILGGFLTDWFIRRTGNRKWGRRLFGVIGHSMCAGFFLACLFVMDSPFLFFLFISLAAFCNDLTMGSAWAVCQDIGKRYSAIVAGWMNTIGNLGGFAAGFVTAEILNSSLDSHAQGLGKTRDTLTAAEKNTGLLAGYEINIAIFMVAYVIAALLWLRIDATRPVAQGEVKPEGSDGGHG